jgi:hypothetical protein
MLRVVSDVVVQPLTGSYYIGYIWHATPPTIATIWPSLTRKSINAASFWTQQHNTHTKKELVRNQQDSSSFDRWWEGALLCVQWCIISFLFPFFLSVNDRHHDPLRRQRQKTTWDNIPAILWESSAINIFHDSFYPNDKRKISL